MKKLSTLNVIKLAYLSWSLLYLVETLASMTPSNQTDLTELHDLGGVMPDQIISDFSAISNEFSLIITAVVILSGWLVLRALPKNRAWAFFTFVFSCILSMLGNLWTFFFPEEISSFFSSRFLQLCYLALLFIMIKFAYNLREEFKV